MANIWTEGSASALAVLKHLLDALVANGTLTTTERDKIVSDSKALLKGKGTDFDGSAELVDLTR